MIVRNLGLTWRHHFISNHFDQYFRLLRDHMSKVNFLRRHDLFWNFVLKLCFFLHGAHYNKFEFGEFFFIIFFFPKKRLNWQNPALLVHALHKHALTQVRSLSSFKVSRQVLWKTWIKSHPFPCSWLPRQRKAFWADSAPFVDTGHLVVIRGNY